MKKAKKVQKKVEKKAERKVPQLPMVPVAVISIAILLIIMLYSGSRFQPFLESARTTISEGPLEKNTMLQLKSGESYTYEYHLENTTLNMTFNVGRGPGCTILNYEESTSVDACLDQWGNDRSGMNTSLSNPMLIVFKPWMLAVDGGWTWSASMNMAFEDVENEVLEMEYSTVRLDEYRGRKVYVVKISTGGSDTFVYVDDEKRILLKEMGEGYEIELVSGVTFED
jgi:hypothetical protein